jgi:phosphoglycerate dehydrogenase-like enzyme
LPGLERHEVFLTLDNVVLTPHVGWVTDAGVARMAHDPVANILAFLDGKPQYVVTPPAARQV